MSAKKIQSTKNYRLFTRSKDNRQVDLKKHKKLVESMKVYGFLACFPIVCFRGDGGVLLVKDGQHRLTVAETLGLPVSWVEESVDFDIATINSTAKTWQLKDYAEKFALNGKEDYREGMEFAKTYGLPLGTAFALLAGTVSFGNIDDGFYAGEFKVKDQKWAYAVAGIYGPMVRLSGHLRNQRFIEACMAVCRVDGFEAKRLLSNAERCSDKLRAFSTREAYLEMLEEVYNHGMRKLVAIKIEAIKVMRERSAIKAGRKGKPSDERNGMAES